MFVNVTLIDVVNAFIIAGTICKIRPCRQNLKLLMNAALSTPALNTFNLIENRRALINYALPWWISIKVGNHVLVTHTERLPKIIRSVDALKGCVR